MINLIRMMYPYLQVAVTARTAQCAARPTPVTAAKVALLVIMVALVKVVVARTDGLLRTRRKWPTTSMR